MANQKDIGVYLRTSTVYTPATIGRLNPMSEEFKEFLVYVTQDFTDIANILNKKDTGYYITTEINTSQQWFQPVTASADGATIRNTYRTVINFGALPNAGTKSVAHNIEGITAGTFSWTYIAGTATDAAANGIPLPFSSPTLNENIKLTADATNVNVTTAIDYSAYTTY